MVGLTWAVTLNWLTQILAVSQLNRKAGRMQRSDTARHVDW